MAEVGSWHPDSAAGQEKKYLQNNKYQGFSLSSIIPAD